MFDWIKRLAAVSALALVAACGGGDDDHPPPGTLAQVATAGGFNALVAAADKAGLVPALSSSSAGLTVFAPTDSAFTSLATSLGFASANAMVAALDGPTLAKILQYHVLPTKKLAADLATGGATQATLYTFEGSAATLALDTSAGVKITDEVLNVATVTSANVPASNGVIHVIDKVLVPPGVLNVVQMAQANPAFSTLVGAVVSANLQGPLSDPAATLTVFAPTNDAFAAIASTVAGLTTQQLTTVLTYHVLGTQVLAADIPFGTPVTTLSTQDITINAGTPPTITDTTSTPASIVATDVRASNGVIHVIGKVLIPTL
jgi:transforming growth factor-beta-induced protein